MASIIKTGFLSVKWTPTIQTLRFRRVNVQRPRAPHYERAKVLALIKPEYPKILPIPPALSCKKSEELEENKRIDNPYERIIAQEALVWFNSSKMIAFFHNNPSTGEENFQVKLKLKKEQMELKVYSHHTLKIALENTHYAAVLKLFQTHSAIVFSEETQVPKLLKVIKKTPHLILMAAIVEGRLLSVSQLTDFSKIPNLTAARSQLVSSLNLAGSQMVSHLTRHQTNLVSQLDQYCQIKEQESNTSTLPEG